VTIPGDLPYISPSSYQLHHQFFDDGLGLFVHRRRGYFRDGPLLEGFTKKFELFVFAVVLRWHLQQFGSVFKRLYFYQCLEVLGMLFGRFLQYNRFIMILRDLTHVLRAMEICLNIKTDSGTSCRGLEDRGQTVTILQHPNVPHALGPMAVRARLIQGKFVFSALN
jgi:hypothetical protein